MFEKHTPYIIFFFIHFFVFFCVPFLRISQKQTKTNTASRLFYEKCFKIFIHFQWKCDSVIAHIELIANSFGTIQMRRMYTDFRFCIWGFRIWNTKTTNIVLKLEFNVFGIDFPYLIRNGKKKNNCNFKTNLILFSHTDHGYVETIFEFSTNLSFVSVFLRLINNSFSNKKRNIAKYWRCCTIVYYYVDVCVCMSKTDD